MTFGQSTRVYPFDLLQPQPLLLPVPVVGGVTSTLTLGPSVRQLVGLWWLSSISMGDTEPNPRGSLSRNLFLNSPSPNKSSTTVLYDHPSLPWVIPVQKFVQGDTQWPRIDPWRSSSTSCSWRVKRVGSPLSRPHKYMFRGVCNRVPTTLTLTSTSGNRQFLRTGRYSATLHPYRDYRRWGVLPDPLGEFIFGFLY